MANLKEINGLENFQEEVTKASGAVLVDFWAPWCGPCQVMTKVLDKLAEEYKGRLQIVKVNVDDNNELASAHSVMSIPTLKLYKDGREVDTMIGALPHEDLVSKLEQNNI